MAQVGPPPVPPICRLIAAALVFVADLVSCHVYNITKSEFNILMWLQLKFIIYHFIANTRHFNRRFPNNFSTSIKKKKD